MPHVAALVDEFARQLEAIAARHRGHPHDELVTLWRLALEREAIVGVAYRRDVVEDRLRRMPVSPEARRVIARAVRWAWRDEEAHALWIRSVLLRGGDLVERLRSGIAELEGRVAGWASSRQHHLSWAEAPATRLGAEIVEGLGVAAGRIPEAVRGDLHHLAFRDYCRLNVAAETTAAMAWRRMVVIVQEHGIETDAGDVAAFERMAEDEDRHAGIFGALADAFDGEDRLRAGIDAASLRDRVGAVGQRFLAVPGEGRPAWGNPLGKGAPVSVREGGLDAALDAVLADVDLEGLLAAQRPADRPLRVALKVTFMMQTLRGDPSPAVSAALLHALCDRLTRAGASVVLLEAPNLYDQHRRGRGVLEVARWLGLEPLHVVDAAEDQVPQDFARGLGQRTVSRAWRDADVRVLVGKLRSHPTSQVMLSLEAAEGLGARHDEFLWDDRGAERETATLMLLDALPPDLAILDAHSDVPDGLLGMIGAPEPLQPRRLYGSRDAVALDALAARHVGVDPEDESTLVRQAFDWFGDPREASPVLGHDTPIAHFRTPEHGLRTAVLMRLAAPVFRYASGRGALFLPEFDDDAFPLLEPEPAGRAALRALVWALVADPASAPDHELLPARFETVAGGALRIARLGDSGGVPLVLLHGYPDTLQIFSRLAPRLAGARPIVAFDWPGLGGSQGRPGRLGPADLAERLRGILDHLGVARADVAGFDMGGQAALAFAALHPERVGRVVVSNALLFGDAPASLEIAVMRRTGLADLAFRFAGRLVYERCLATFLDPGEELPPEVESDLWGAFQRRDVRRTLAELCAAYEASMDEMPALYGRVRAPVLALWGEEEAHFPAAHAERLAETVAGARVRVLPRARHWMAWTRPAEVADAIADFLEAPWTS